MNKLNYDRQIIVNEVIECGAWDAGVKVATEFPGTCFTEILEYLEAYPAGDLNSQRSNKENVALDVSIRASFEGVMARR